MKARLQQVLPFGIIWIPGKVVAACLEDISIQINWKSCYFTKSEAAYQMTEANYWKFMVLTQLIRTDCMIILRTTWANNFKWRSYIGTQNCSFLFHVHECFAGGYIYTTYMQWLLRSDKGVRTPGAVVTECFEVPHGCCKPNLGPPARAANALNCWAISPVPYLRTFLAVDFSIRWVSTGAHINQAVVHF